MPGRRSVVSVETSSLAVALVFASNGFALASLLSRTPDIRGQIGAAPTELAFALVCLGTGSLLGMPFTDRVIDRYSSRWVTRLSATIRLAGYMILPMIRSVSVLAFAFFIIGIGMGASAVAMNVQGHLVERRWAKVWMPFWHGLFSFGGAAGALVGALAVSLHVSLAWQMAFVAVMVQIVIWNATRGFLADDGAHLSGEDGTVEEPIFDEPQAIASSRHRSVVQFGKPAITLTEILLGPAKVAWTNRQPHYAESR